MSKPCASADAREAWVEWRSNFLPWMKSWGIENTEDLAKVNEEMKLCFILERYQT